MNSLAGLARPTRLGGLSPCRLGSLSSRLGDAQGATDVRFNLNWLRCTPRPLLRPSDVCGSRNARERRPFEHLGGFGYRERTRVSGVALCLALYGGGILSDLITFNLGRLTQRGLGKRIQEAVFRTRSKLKRRWYGSVSTVTVLGSSSALALGRVCH